MKKNPIDEYLSSVPPKQRAALEKLRKQIREIVPGVEEHISYRMPAFRFRDRVIAGFIARKDGCSYFPFSGRTLKTLAKDIAGYEHTKSALHFDAGDGLPTALVRKLLRARIAELG